MADKLPMPPVLNRPPTQPRPVDKDRFKSIDMLPEDSADPVTQRMIRDIEAMQQRQGWLRSSGAFDKDDLLYLHDKEKQQRQAELEQRDLEAAAFAAARARAARQQQEAEHASLALQIKQPAAGGGSSSSSASSKQQTSKTTALPQPLVKVKHRHDKSQQQATAAAPPAAPAAAPVAAPTAPAAAATVADHLQQPAAKKQRLGALELAVSEQQQQQQRVVHSHWEQDNGSPHSGVPGQPPSIAVQQPLDADGRLHSVDVRPKACGLDALLGAYGSDSEADASEDTSQEAVGADDSKHDGAAGAAAEQKLALPSAAELLEQDVSGSFAEQHRQQQQQQQQQAGVATLRAAGVSSYQPQLGWI